MQCVRVDTLYGLQMIEPLILGDEDSPRERFLAQLVAAISNQDRSVYVAAVINDDETKIIGLGVAEANPSQSFVFIHQANVLPEGGKAATSLLWSRLVAFAQSVNRVEIRCFSKRATALARARGFREISTLLGYTLHQDAQDLIFGDDNGWRHTSDQRSDRVTEQHQSSHVPVSDGSGSRTNRPEASERGRTVSGMGPDEPLRQRDSIRVEASGSILGTGGISTGSEERSGRSEHSTARSSGARTSVPTGSAERDAESVAEPNAGSDAESIRRSESSAVAAIPPELLGTGDARAAESRVSESQATEQSER